MNSAISWTNRADRPRSVGKFSLILLQILSFAQGPSCQSHSDLKNEKASRASQKTCSVLQTSFFLISGSFGFDFFLFHPHYYPFSASFPHP